MLKIKYDVLWCKIPVYSTAALIITFDLLIFLDTFFKKSFNVIHITNHTSVTQKNLLWGPNYTHSFVNMENWKYESAPM